MHTTLFKYIEHISVFQLEMQKKSMKAYGH